MSATETMAVEGLKDWSTNQYIGMSFIEGDWRVLNHILIGDTNEIPFLDVAPIFGLCEETFGGGERRNASRDK